MIQDTAYTQLYMYIKHCNGINTVHSSLPVAKIKARKKKHSAIGTTTSHCLSLSPLSQHEVTRPLPTGWNASPMQFNPLYSAGLP